MRSGNRDVTTHVHVHIYIYSQTSVHERLGSWTIRFTNKFSKHKVSRMTYCVSSYEHASRQHRGVISWKNPLPNNNISLPHHLPLTPSALHHTGTYSMVQRPSWAANWPAFQGTRRFITALTSVRHLSLSRARPIQSIYPHPLEIHPNIIHPSTPRSPR